VLILHWKGLENTLACLASLEENTYRNQKILVVDNGSPNNDCEILKERYPQIDVLRLNANYGFAGGCNRGMEKALKDGSDYIWLLNNDALAKLDSTAILMKAAQENPQAGALGAAIIEGSGADRKPAGYGLINFKKAKTYLKALAPDDKRQTIECQWLSGSNLLLKAEALKTTGLFDERYFLYFEDVELCYRLSRHGYKCLLVPGTYIEHEGNASTQGGLKLWRSYYHTRNRALFFTENSPPGTLPVALTYIHSHFLRHLFSLPLKGKAGQYRLQAEYLGLKDFYTKNFGEAKCLKWCEQLKL
jgi:GT2 family glycosyltransferase